MKALRIFILALPGFVSLPANAKPIEEMPELRQVGHLTEIAAAKFVDLKQVKRIKGEITVLKGFFPLTDNGIAEAMKFIKTQKEFKSSKHETGMFRVTTSIRFDDEWMQPFSAIVYDSVEPQDVDDLVVIEKGLQKARDHFAKIMAAVR